MAWGWVPSPSWGGSALDPIPGSWVALGFFRTRGQILTVLLLPAPGERQAFLLKGPSGAEPCLDGGSCVRLQLQPSLQFWNRFLQLEALMGVGSCMLPMLGSSQTRVGASHGQRSRRPPQRRQGPQLLPICRVGLQRPCQS